MLWLLLLVGQMEGVRLAPHPSDAVPVVLADVQAMGERASACRYVWVPTDRDKAQQQINAMQYAINAACNHSDLPQRCVVLEHGVIRVDLAAMAREDETIVRDLLNTWDQFGGTDVGKDDHDAYFLTNTQQLTDSVQRVLVKTDKVASFVPVEIDPLNIPSNIKPTQYVLKGGRVIKLAKPWDTLSDSCIVSVTGLNGESIVAVIPKGVLVLQDAIRETRAPAPYLPQEEMAEIFKVTGSRAPIVHADEFVRRALTQVDGFGLYYRFRRVRKSPDPNVTDFDFIISGITGLTMDKVVELRGRQMAVLLASKVTGRQRLVWAFQGGQSKLGVNSGRVVVTGDFAKNTPDHLKPYASMDEAQPQAFEVFVELPDGGILTLLFQGFEDGKFVGSLQDEAPASIATDHAAPAAEDRRVNGHLSCVRCHTIHMQQKGPWIVFESDLGKRLRDGKINFTTIGGIKDPTRLANLTGELMPVWERPLIQANEDFNAYLDLLTGDVQLGAENSPSERVIGSLVNLYGSAVHEPVDAVRALRYAGLEVDEDAAGQVLDEMFQAVPGQVRYVADLADGARITSESWRAIAVDFIRQATPAREALKAELAK